SAMQCICAARIASHRGKSNSATSRDEEFAMAPSHSRRRAAATASVVAALIATLVAGLVWTTSASAVDQDALTSKFMPMPDQTYALCAGAIAFNFDGVTYAKCRLKKGNSLAAAHVYSGGDALTVNEQLTKTGPYMVSTYSPPDPENYALYKCERDGAFAQCNGGLCYRYDGDFPGVGKVGPKEVMCSCPIAYKKTTYHVTGPAQCPTTRAAYDKICGSGKRADVTADGTILHIGAGGPPATTIDGLNKMYDAAFGTKTPTPPTCARPAR
ncbi:MAG: hypothetical protein ACO3RL_12355, partial [Vulcanococcus sp.]